MIRLIVISLFLATAGVSVTVQAQVRSDTTASGTVERILESLDEDAGDASQLIDFLASLRESPVDVNSASVSELAQIPSIDELLAFAIVGFRDANGDFQSLPELQLIDGITEDVFADARPYLTIGDQLVSASRRPSPYPRALSLREIAGGLRYDLIQRVTRRVDLGDGYSDDSTRTTYAGTPERVYTRLRARVGRRVSLNFTGEKDPGESFFWDPNGRSYGYDHVSMHLAVKDFGRIKSLVLGDYSVAFGQGLVFWKGLSPGKGRDVISPATRSGSGFSPYGSTDENSFLRGGATTIRITPKLSVSGFGSRRTLDATVIEIDTTDGFGPAIGSDLIEESNLTNTGLHRTPNELSKRDALRETIFGGNIEYVGERIRIGTVAYSGQFDTPLIPGNAAYERYRFRGDNIGVASIYGSAFLGSYQLFGEVARDQEGNVAAIAGTSVRIGRGARAVLSARRYPRGYTNLHSYAFGESNGSTQNESGVYVGLQLKPASTWSVAGYFDQYRFPWVRFGVSLPSRGHEALLIAEHKPRRWVTTYIQLRTETKEGGYRYTDSLNRIIDGVRNETRQSARLNLQYEFSKQLTLRSRVEGTRFQTEGERASLGTLLLQDFRWKVTPSFQLDGRWMIFDTDGFDARVFTYEYDLRYAFAIPSFSGRGQRTYLLASFTPVESIFLHLK